MEDDKITVGERKALDLISACLDSIHAELNAETTIDVCFGALMGFASQHCSSDDIAAFLRDAAQEIENEQPEIRRPS